MDDGIFTDEERTETTENYDYESDPDADIGIIVPSMEYTYAPGMPAKQRKDRLYFGFETANNLNGSWRRHC